MFLNEPKSAHLIFQNEFLKGRIFNFLNKPNYNYFLGNEVVDVYDSLFDFFHSFYTKVIQDICNELLIKLLLLVKFN